MEELSALRVRDRVLVVECRACRQCRRVLVVLQDVDGQASGGTTDVSQIVSEYTMQLLKELALRRYERCIRMRDTHPSRLRLIRNFPDFLQRKKQRLQHFDSNAAL